MNCDICNEKLIPPSGPKTASIGLMGEFPGWYEIEKETVFVGPTGDILKRELAKQGISFMTCLATNLWGHAPNDDEAELSLHFSTAIRALKKCRAVFLMGSDVSQAVFGENIMSISGMVMESDLFSNAEIVIAAPNPAVLAHGGLGEFRLALGAFAQLCHKKRIL